MIFISLAVTCRRHGGSSPAADRVPVMILAIVISVIVMMIAAKSIGEFVDHHPDHQDARTELSYSGGRSVSWRGVRPAYPKGHIYFAMAFSVLVAMLNIGYGANAPNR